MSGEREIDHGLDAAAYLLGALEPEEAVRFQTHLPDCELCGAEVTRLGQGVELLAREVPVVPLPSDLRGRLMHQVRSEAQLLQAAGSGADRAPARRRGWSWPETVRSRLLGGAGALALACGIALAVVLATGSSAPVPQTIPAQMADVPAGASAELVRTGSRAELVVAGLPQPPRGRIYQVWLQGRDGPPRPTDALFSVSRAGDGRTEVPGSLHGVHRVMVTAEPLGGSRHPTRAPIIIATI